jgi:hypothetical protein
MVSMLQQRLLVEMEISHTHNVLPHPAIVISVSLQTQVSAPQCHCCMPKGSLQQYLVVILGHFAGDLAPGFDRYHPPEFFVWPPRQCI